MATRNPVGYLSGMVNTQPRLSPVTHDDGHVAVHSIFYTMQGEGPFAGSPAVFIRLYGCNLQCPLCDTDYTSRNEPMPPGAILARVEQVTPRRVHLRSRPLIVVTGGEPFRQPIRAFVDLLVAECYPVQIETNGTLSPSVMSNVTIVCSPKTPKLHPDVERRARGSSSFYFKYVLKDVEVCHDGLPRRALDGPYDTLARPPTGFPHSRVFIQPLDEGNEHLNQHHRQVALTSALAHGFRFCLQQHKLLSLP